MQKQSSIILTLGSVSLSRTLHCQQTLSSFNLLVIILSCPVTGSSSHTFEATSVSFRIFLTFSTSGHSKTSGCKSLPSILFSHVWLFATPWTVALLALLSMGFSRQQYWSGLPFSSPGDLPKPRIQPPCPAFQANSLPLSHQRSDPPPSLVLHFLIYLPHIL